jgi:hypothetical protein
LNHRWSYRQPLCEKFCSSPAALGKRQPPGSNLSIHLFIRHLFQRKSDPKARAKKEKSPNNPPAPVA